MTGTAGPSDAVLRRIRALVDQATSTGFAAEAEAFLAKAAELSARHRVSEAMLAAAGGGRPTEHVVERPVELGRGPYVNARLWLLAACGEACDCTTLHTTGYAGKTAVLVGHDGDTARAEELYTSLLVQASVAMAATPVPGGQPAVAFRRAFLFAWAAHVGERFREAAARAEAEAATPAGAAGGGAGTSPSSVALVLAGRRRAVDDHVARTYGRVRAGRPPEALASRDGAAAGRDAARRAELGGRPGVGGSRRALGPGGR